MSVVSGVFLFQKLKTVKYENNDVSIPVKIIRKTLWFVGTGNMIIMSLTGCVVTSGYRWLNCTC